MYYKDKSRLLINDSWWTVQRTDTNNVPIVHLTDGVNCIAVRAKDIEHIVAEVSEPDCEWVTSVQASELQLENWQVDAINQKLTNLFGQPPRIRKYDGESSQDYGLLPDSEVLYWDMSWYLCMFRELDIGDDWIYAPKSPDAR
jgi:hypothetical protein